MKENVLNVNRKKLRLLIDSELILFFFIREKHTAEKQTQHQIVIKSEFINFFHKIYFYIL